MIKIVDDVRENLIGDHGQSFFVSENLFEEIQAYVLKHEMIEGSCFPILDRNGKLLFYVTYLEDLIAGIKRKELSDYDSRMRNPEELDFTFLDQYQRFVFLGVDNYSIAIARLLQKNRPDKRIIFCDRRAKYFIHGGKRIKYLSFFYNAERYMELIEEWMRGTGGSFLNRVKAFTGWKILGRLKSTRESCIIKTDRRNHPDEEGVVYNSQNVVYSLLWRRKKRYFGEKNAEKEIVVLDYSCNDEGLGSIVKCAFAHIMWMTKRGYVPVMNLSVYPNQYLNTEGENMWEYFFEPVSSVSVADAYKSKNVIVATENDISWCDFHISPYQREYMKEFINREDFRRIVRINQATKEYIDMIMPKAIREGARVLGVVMRGGAFRKEAAKRYNKEWRKDIVDPDVFLQACNYYKDKLQCEYIFLATEDKEYFEMAQKFLGDKILFVEQKRTSYDYANEEEIPLNDAFGWKDGKMAGRNYLAVIKGLEACDALLYNVECGAVRMAWYWKTDKYEVFQCIGSNWKENL